MDRARVVDPLLETAGRRDAGVLLGLAGEPLRHALDVNRRLADTPALPA